MKPMNWTRRVCLAAALSTASGAWCLDTTTGETTDIRFSTTDAAPLKAKADELGSPIKIFEFLHNEAQYRTYHGARSGSINSFMGLRGNDVDISAALIAMLRARGVPARYAVGTVRVATPKVMNWLRVENADLAYQILRNQGIQKVAIAGNKSTIDFEHVWVEALVPYGNYRGAGNSSINCASTPQSCNWVPLDASFKQHASRASGLDPLTGKVGTQTFTPVAFDYNAYYRAVKDNDPKRRDKNPLAIYQEQILAWLQTNAPGKTLEDIPDFGAIVERHEGLLPASLPFVLLDVPRTYNSAADHDLQVPAKEAKRWHKNLDIKIHLAGTDTNGAAVSIDYTVSASRLTELATKRFTITTELGTNSVPDLVARLGGTEIARLSTAASTAGYTPKLYDPFKMTLTMEGSPAPDAAGTDELLSAEYDGVVGGYYLIATGGEWSNWTQVHRAAAQLLADNTAIKIVFNPSDPGLGAGHPCDPGPASDHINCTPYVDRNGNGWDATDPKLLNDRTSLDSLTGGLLWVAATQYYAKLRETMDQIERLNKTIAPISGFLGVVSSVYEAEYVDGTAFEILPGGLLIDMKAINQNGPWRIDQAAGGSNAHIDLFSHAASALEHEVWQELTGYDAVSTMRGIQLALLNGATMVNPKKSPTQDNLAASFASLGFQSTPPAGFTRKTYSIFGGNYLSWSYSGTNSSAAFTVMRPNIQGIPVTDPRARRWTFATWIDNAYKAYDDIENLFLSRQAQEGQLKTGVVFPTAITQFQNGQDVLFAQVASPSGFALSGYARTNANTYNFSIDETSQHADGSFPIVVYTKTGDALNEQTYNISGFGSYTSISSVTVSSPGGFAVKSFSRDGANPDVMHVTVIPTTSLGNGVYTVNLYFLAQAPFGTDGLTAPVSLEVLGNRFVDGYWNVSIGSLDVSDSTSVTCNGGTDQNGVPNGNPVTYTGTPTQLLPKIKTCFTYYQQVAGITSLPALGDSSDFIYRSYPPPAGSQQSSVVELVRNDLTYYGTDTNWAEFLLPSITTAVEPQMTFSVNYYRQYETSSGRIAKVLAAIRNDTGLQAGGGYVNGTEPLSVSNSITPVTPVATVLPTFQNSTLTAQNTIGEVNNDRLKTPSTTDPVSTVTGNNFHDETDLFIRGRGIDYAFTRTYNSSPAATAVRSSLGYGWVHSYGMRLVSKDYGSCPDCAAAQAAENADNKTSSIIYTDERGGDHSFFVNTSGQVFSPQGEFDKLELNTPSVGLHRLTFRNGTKYLFEAVDATGNATTSSSYYLHVVPRVTARLKQISDPWGNELNFTYASGRLATVTDNLGISTRTGLTFTYDGATGNLQTVRDWGGRTWTYVVGTTGNLESYTGPVALNTAGAKTHVYGYAAGTHNLETITKPLARDGKAVRSGFTYYQNGKTFRNYNGLDEAESLDYDLFRKSTRVTDPRGGVRDYEYDSYGRLVKLTEPDGGILLFTNNADGLRDSKTDGQGYKTQYSYRVDRAFGCPLNTGGPSQNKCSDTGGNVTLERDPLNRDVETTYGAYDQVASVKDRRGSVRRTSYHTTTDTTCKVAGKPDTDSIDTLTVTPGTNRTSVLLASYCWYADGAPRSRTEYLDANNAARTRVTTYFYTDPSHLNVDHVTATGWDGATVTRSFTYDGYGRKMTETIRRRTSPSDATLLSLTTTYTYDNADRVLQVEDAAGNKVITRFDDNGQAWQVTHQYLKPDSSYISRNVVTRTFDAADRVKTETDAMGGLTKTTYDAAGNAITVTDPEGHTTAAEFDAMNRRIAAVDANGARSTTAYNLRGQPVSQTNAAGQTTGYEYDEVGLLRKVTEPHGYVTEYRYDPNGNQTCVIDANAAAGLQQKNADGCTESRVYDQLNRVIQVRNAYDRLTTTALDLAGNPLTRTDAEGRRYVWGYDGLGRLTSETDFSGLSTSFQVDEAGNVWQRKNRLNEVTETTFDKLNRPKSVKYLKDGSTETYAYDPPGTLNSISSASSAFSLTYAFTYDDLNRVRSKQDSRGRSLTFSYDKAGNLLTKTTYQGSTTSYVYDGANRLVALSSPDYLSVNYQYDPTGRLLGRTMSSGGRSIYTYDAGGWMTGMQHLDSKGASLANTSFGRDRVGNITSQTNSAGLTRYTLDSLYRLTAVDAPGTANDEAFTYDGVGNRLTAVRGGLAAGAAGATTRYYTYFPATQTSGTGTFNDRLQEIRLASPTGSVESSFSYDNEGRMTGQLGGPYSKILIWDAKGRLASLTRSGVTESYRYDPLNARVARLGGALGNLDYFLEGDHLESVYSAGALQEKYFRGSTVDELVAGFTMAGGKLTPFIFQHDQVMSVVAASKPNGGAAASLAYWAFGDTQTTTGSLATRLKYTGREDDGTGLYYYRARYYCPSCGGRFISEDPKGFAAGVNIYAYGDNNPINARDPTGNWALIDDAIATVGGGILGLGAQGVADALSGSFSPWRTYVAAGLGGAAAGEAALYTGGVASGAIGGATYSLTQQVLNGSYSFEKFAVDTGISALTAGLGSSVLPALTRTLSNGVKGTIGESASIAYNWLQGSSLLGTQVKIPGLSTIADSAWRSMSGAAYYVESKFGTSTLTSAQRIARDTLGDAYHIERWGYDWVGRVGSTLGNALGIGASSSLGSFGGANGGYLIYPNKPNNNSTSIVYRK